MSRNSQFFRVMVPRGRALRWSLAACGVWLVGCAANPKAVVEEPELEVQTAESETQTALPAVELTAELFYDILVGEIAVQRGHFSEAARHLHGAAKSSRDYRLAERASTVALQAKEYERALQAARLWSELRPADSKPLQTIGTILMVQRRLDAAENHFQELIQRAGESEIGIVYRQIAEQLAVHGESEDVMGLMDRLVQMHPDNADAYYAMAFLADRLKQSEIVFGALNQALALRPGWQEAALAKFSYYISQQDFDGASGFSDEFLREYPGANKIRLHYARYLIDQENREAALENFEILAERDPKSVDAVFAAGLLSVQLDRFEDAENYLKKTVELRPDNDQARLYLGQIAAERKQYDKAAKWYQEIRSENLLFDAQVSLARVISKQSGYEKGLAHLDSMHPRNDEEHVRLILSKEHVLREAKRPADAKTLLDEGLQQFPDNTDLLYARGLLAAQLDLLVLHEQDMRRLLEKEPQNAHALNALGYTLADQTERYQEALELIDQALKLKPEDPFIMDSMGWVQYRLGNHQLAIEYLERALEKREDAEIAAHLGEVLWVIGEKTRAEKVLKRALKKSPDNDVLLTTIEKLKQ